MKKSWRDDPITRKQKEFIQNIEEFSLYRFPAFEGSTKGEAHDYIQKYGEDASEDVSSPTYGY